MPHLLRALLGTALVASFLSVSGTSGPARAEEDALAAHRAMIDGAVPHRTTAHFRFFGDASVHGTLERLAETAESRLSWMCNQLRSCDRLVPPIDVWVAEDAQTFARAFPGETPMSEWAAGVAFLKEQRIVLRAHGTAVFTLRETFEHELAHVLTHSFTPDGVRWPRWFSEGLAIWLSGESMVERMNSAMKAAAWDNLLPPEELTAAFPLEGSRVETAYAQSAFAARWAARQAGTAGLVALLHDVAGGASFDAAFHRHVGVTPHEAIAKGTERIEDSVSFFYHFWDGNLIWGLVTLLFIVVAWWRIKERRAQLARLDEAESARVAEEDAALLDAWQRTREAPPEPRLIVPPELLN